MTRPALVIGVGGSGQWALTYLKKDLLESNNGVLPANVRLVCFDTMPHPDAGVTTAQQAPKDKFAKVGSIQLVRDTEFIHLGDDVYKLSELVRDDEIKRRRTLDETELGHLSNWFRAEYWINHLPKAAFNLTDGAGQLRQFGRMALFNDLDNRLRSKTIAAIKNNIDQLKDGLKGQQLEIIIVGSFAGGTGSGMFLDIALLARLLARGVPTLIRGYMVLPGAFADESTNADMAARAFAAWRELNRFMVISKDFGLPSLIYNNSNSNRLKFENIQNKLFDTCYLVDGVRGKVDVAAEAEKGVHPTIAEAISAVLDEKAGEKYTRWAANLAPLYAAKENQGIPLYSAVGTFTYKVPIYYAQQTFSHRFTSNWLDQLIKPIKDDRNAPNRVTRISAQSPEDGSRVGRQDATRILLNKHGYKGKEAAPTIFYRSLVEVLDKGDEDEALITQYARGSSSSGKTWQTFVDLSDRKDIADVVMRVQKEAKLKLRDSICPSKDMQGEKPRDFIPRAGRDLPAFVSTHYGHRNVDGTENVGKYGEMLKECSNAQTLIFKDLLETWLLNTLMGGDKRGRLGYAWDLLDGMHDRFQTFTQCMDKVRKKRQELRPELEIRTRRDNAHREMLDYCNKRFLIFFDDPRANDYQERYLATEQALVELRKDDLLHITVLATVRAMQLHCDNMRDELRRWAELLALGNPATKVESLYVVMERERRDLESTKQADVQMDQVQERLPDLPYPEDFEKNEINGLMAGIEWTLDANDKLQLAIKMTDEGNMGFERPRGAETQDAMRSLTNRNISGLRGYAQRRFSGLKAETRVAEKLREKFGDAEALARDMKNKAEPLARREEGKGKDAARMSELIRVSTEGIELITTQFLQGRKRDGESNEWIEDGLEQQVRALRNMPKYARDEEKLIELVGSADQHKCTIVRTDDLMPFDAFSSWYLAQKAYLNNTRYTPDLNHIFPAERNAAELERKLSDKRHRNYRVFHPWVVMLLEYPKRLEQFFMCLARNWISADKVKGVYLLRAPKHPVIQLTPISEPLHSLFQAARYYVLEGHDQVTGSTRRVNYATVDQALKDEQTSLGADWAIFLQRNTYDMQTEDYRDDSIGQMFLKHSDRLKQNLSERIALPEGEPGNFEQAYLDFADVATLMFEQRHEMTLL